MEFQQIHKYNKKMFQIFSFHLVQDRNETYHLDLT